MAVRGEEEFLNLPFTGKLDFLYGLPARHKRDLILSAPEAERLVQSFSPESLFYTLKEIGIPDSSEMLSLAIPEQIKGLFDLDCWNKDRPNLARMREWIEAMGESGRRRLADSMMELDLELVTLFMRKYLRVYRLDEAESALDISSQNIVQFDHHYVIEFIRQDSILPLVQDFIEEIFERDYDYYASLLEEIYWGVEAELEEQAYRFRRARLNDRGFPDFFDAQNVFAYLNPRQFIEIRSAHVPPLRDDSGSAREFSIFDTALMHPETDNSLFNIALMAGFGAQGQRQLRSEIALVANEVLIARATDFGDLEAVRSTVEMTHHYLNLGLEHLAGGELRDAIDNLKSTHLKLLFRLGVSLTLDLRKRAEDIVTKLGLKADETRRVSYLDLPYTEALAGFLQRVPRFYSGLDGSGSIMMRNFREMRDLHLGYAVLEQIDAIPGLFKQLFEVNIASAAFRVTLAGREIRLSQILLTALTNCAIDGTLSMAPIAASRLREVRTAIAGDRRPASLSDHFRKLVAETLHVRLGPDLERRSAAYINSCLNLLEEEMADLDPAQEIDPRFIRTLLLRRD